MLVCCEPPYTGAIGCQSLMSIPTLGYEGIGCDLTFQALGDQLGDGDINIYYPLLNGIETLCIHTSS